MYRYISLIKYIIDILLRNPVFLWIKWSCQSIYLKIKYPSVRLYYKAVAYKSVLGSHVTLYENVSLSNCTVGDYTYIANGSSIGSSHIGKFCSIGPNVLCGVGRHPTKDFVSTHPSFFSQLCQAQITFVDKNYFEETLPIKIGNDVWIGANVVILGGVCISDGAIIAAGAIVNKDVPAYAIVGGVPSKVLKYRFSTEEIEFLKQNQWWNKDLKWIKNNWRIMHDITEYIECFRRD